METNLQYYARRAAEELRAAANAESAEAQIRHRTLAEKYAVIVQEQANIPADLHTAEAAED
ncbi:hypothetical protein [Sphingomonas sp.]|uniref:hypothetical protein n=1 Tax=Sphingomonas sp. TaxID=28214 RepID=UPI002FCCAFBC